MEPLEGRLLLTLTVQDDSLSVDADSGVNSSSFSVLDNDSSTVGPLTAAMVMPATNGAVALNPDGYFDYTPNTGFVGQDTFTYSASDGSETANGTVTVSVTSGGGGGGSSSPEIEVLDPGQSDIVDGTTSFNFGQTTLLFAKTFGTFPREYSPLVL